MAFRSVASRLRFWVAGTVGLLFAIALLYSFVVSRRIVLGDSERLALRTAEAYASEIERDLRSIEQGTRLLGTILSETSVSKDELEQVIRSFVEGDPRIYGSTAAVSPERERYSPYVHRSPGGIARVDLANDSYRYWEKDWYTSAASAGTALWSEPYFDEGGGNVSMVTYSVPVFRMEASERKFLGVVTADVSIEWLSETVQSERLGLSAYAIVLSRGGRILAHPDPRFIGTDGTEIENARSGAEATEEIVARMLRGEEGFVPYYDRYLGKMARAAFRPVGGAGWSFAAVYPEDSLLDEVYGLARAEIAILGGGLVALLLVVAWISTRLTRPIAELSASAREIATGNLDAEIPPVASKDEVGALTSSFHHMRDSLQAYVRDLEATTKAKERLESELEIARRIQRDMLPSGHAGGRPGDGFELEAILEPARQIGGDLYEHFLSDGKLTFVVGDVSGKGVGAALFMARAKTMFRSVSSRVPDLAEVLRSVNRGLCEENEQGMFVTLFAGSLDLVTGELSYASAGHDAPVLVSEADGSTRLLQLEGGPVLGLLEASDYQTEQGTLHPGDVLVLYTDGVSEALNENGDFFTIERLLQHLSRAPGGTTTDVARGVFALVKAFAGRAPQSDDITVMAVRYRAAPAGTRLRELAEEVTEKQ